MPGNIEAGCRASYAHFFVALTRSPSRNSPTRSTAMPHCQRFRRHENTLQHISATTFRERNEPRLRTSTVGERLTILTTTLGGGGREGEEDTASDSLEGREKEGRRIMKKNKTLPKGGEEELYILPKRAFGSDDSF